MTVAESKGLKKGRRVYWRGDAADGGSITEISWDAVTIAWDNGPVVRVLHGDSAKSSERRQNRPLCRYCVRPVECPFCLPRHLRRDWRGRPGESPEFCFWHEADVLRSLHNVCCRTESEHAIRGFQDDCRRSSTPRQIKGGFCLIQFLTAPAAAR